MNTEQKPVPLLTIKDANEWLYDDDCGSPNQRFTDALEAVATGRVACHDTEAGKFVPFISEAEAREMFVASREAETEDWLGYLAALRDLGLIVPNDRDEQQRGQLSSAEIASGEVP